jgi:YD repeat-containing protein
MILTANAQTAVSDEALDSRSQVIESEAPKERLSENWSDEDVFRLRTLGEPLVADSRVSSEEERAAFSKALNAYLLNGQPENLEAFLRQWPESRWAAALEHNLGLLKYREGFFTAAMAYWKSAIPVPSVVNWKLGHYGHATDVTQKSSVLECVKESLENRVWFNYPGQTSTSSDIEGTSHAPNRVARVTEDGTTQLWQYDRNELAYVTRSVDPLGRETLFDFAPNGIDLLTVRQKNGSTYDTIASYTWNSQHRPLAFTDAAGKTTTYTWNARGQLLTTTNPLNQTTSFTYNAQGYLETIDPRFREQAT